MLIIFSVSMHNKAVLLVNQKISIFPIMYLWVIFMIIIIIMLVDGLVNSPPGVVLKIPEYMTGFSI